MCLVSKVINKYSIQRNTTHRDKPESYRKCYRCRNRNRQRRHWRRPGCHSSEIVTWCPLHTSRCRSPRKPRNPSCRQLKDDIKSGRCQRWCYLLLLLLLLFLLLLCYISKENSVSFYFCCCCRCCLFAQDQSSSKSFLFQGFDVDLLHRVFFFFFFFFFNTANTLNKNFFLKGG